MNSILMISNFIHYHIIHNKIKKDDMALELGIIPTELNDYFKRDYFQLSVLHKLIMVLKHNF